jgi:hypothetical protein
MFRRLSDAHGVARQRTEMRARGRGTSYGPRRAVRRLQGSPNREGGSGRAQGVALMSASATRNVYANSSRRDYYLHGE